MTELKRHKVLVAARFSSAMGTPNVHERVQRRIGAARSWEGAATPVVLQQRAEARAEE